MNTNSISIVTVTQLYRFETFKLLLDMITRQTYKNIKEWIIVEGSRTPDEANCNKVLLTEFFESNKDKNINFVYVPSTYSAESNNKIGALRNRGDKLATGDIIIRMDDDDYYFPKYFEHCVSKLRNSDKLLACATNIYLYDIMIGKVFKSNITPIVLAYKRNYILDHSCDETINSDEDETFTNKYTEPMETLMADNTVVKIIHASNTFFKKVLTLAASVTSINQITKLEDETIKYLLPKEFNDMYRKIYIQSDYLDYDLVYLTGGFGITWHPSEKGLGGSEQAIVNLSENWVKLGKKVAVYGNFESDRLETINGVDYYNWTKFPFEKKIKTLVAWRKNGLIFLMNINFNADKLILDFHDNFSYTIADLDPVELYHFFEKVTKFNLKSQYHKTSLEEFMKSHFSKIDPNYQPPIDKFNVINNGVRVNEFSNNTILNDGKAIIRNPYRFCYCSSYDRGLETILTKIWPIIYKAEPRAELHVYYGMDYIYDKNFKTKLSLLLSSPGVMDHGRQPMDMVIREKYLSTFHLYLNNSIAEIDCITIKESLVTGCIPVISTFGVFAERHGLQFNFDPSNDIVCQQIAEELINKMKDSSFIDKARELLKMSSTLVTWENVAKRWLETL